MPLIKKEVFHFLFLICLASKTVIITTETKFPLFNISFLGFAQSFMSVFSIYTCRIQETVFSSKELQIKLHAAGVCGF